MGVNSLVEGEWLPRYHIRVNTGSVKRTWMEKEVALIRSSRPRVGVGVGHLETQKRVCAANTFSYFKRLVFAGIPNERTLSEEVGLTMGKRVTFEICDR